MKETLNVVFVRVNLGIFQEMSARPSIREIQNKVNSVFLDIEKSEFLYKRIELTTGDNTELELYFFYKHYNEIPENYLSKLSAKIKKVSKSISGSVQAMQISEDELDKFNKLHDDSETGIATEKQNKDARVFADAILIKYKNMIITS